VDLASSGPGGFGDDRCTLEKTRPGVAACAVTYLPAATGAPTSTDTITATYGGDAMRNGSSGTAAVTVRPTSVADCKNRGWRNYGFPNQRQCVLFVKSGGLRATAACAGERATVIGTREAERLRGTHGDDVIVTGGGGDRVLGLRGDDLICGGGGADLIRGGGGDDTLRGGPGKDELRGGHGSNECRGGRGPDDQHRC
jgi:Ca2+-binding RTX toxin-like protein